MSRIAIAVIGGGHLGRIHTRLLQLHPDVELLGVVDPSPAAREQIAAEFGVPTFTHHDHAAHRIKAAILATTTDLHHSVGCDLLARGIHLFVEKPLTTSVALADEMIDLAHRHGLVLQAGHVERFNPAWRAVARQLHRPRFIEATRTSSYTFRSTDIGVVLDLMIHDLDLIVATVRSEVVAIDAVGATIFGPHEDMAYAHLRFANGCVANLKASRTSFQSQRSMQVLTERAYVDLNFASGTARIIRPSKDLMRGRINVHGLPLEQREILKSNLFTDLLPLEDVRVEPGNAIQEEQREFVTCIREGRAPSVTGEHARDCLAIAEQILAQIKHPPTHRDPRLGPTRDDPQLLTAPQWHQPDTGSPPGEKRRAS